MVLVSVQTGIRLSERRWVSVLHHDSLSGENWKGFHRDPWSRLRKAVCPCWCDRRGKSCCKRMNDKLWDLNRLQKQPDEIAAALGEQGLKPYECWYCGCCRGQGPQTVTD